MVKIIVRNIESALRPVRGVGRVIWRKHAVHAFLFLVCFILGVGIFRVLWGPEGVVTKGQEQESAQLKEGLPKPEVSGWVAYWKEAEGYELVQSAGSGLKTISPVWYTIDSNQTLQEVGEQDKSGRVQLLKAQGLQVYPTLFSELRGETLIPFLENKELQNKLITTATQKIKETGSAGIDIDLEHIPKNYAQSFTDFLGLCALRAHERGLQLSVSVHAQTGSPDDWEGVRGQDLPRIGEVADEVRIMAYDYHGPDTEPGAITPLDWLAEVASYSAKVIPSHKLVIGLPSYGYLWEQESTNPIPLQYTEFMARVNTNEESYVEQRDPDSGEAVYTSAGHQGWVSDAVSIHQKIAVVQELGVHRFILWNLGGMDKKFFLTNEPKNK